MNKRQYKFMLKNELSRLNKKIDGKILMGYPYDFDAKRHKTLLHTLDKMSKRGHFFGFRFSRMAKMIFSRMSARTAIF